MATVPQNNFPISVNYCPQTLVGNEGTLHAEKLVLNVTLVRHAPGGKNPTDTPMFSCAFSCAVAPVTLMLTFLCCTCKPEVETVLKPKVLIT